MKDYLHGAAEVMGGAAIFSVFAYLAERGLLLDLAFWSGLSIFLVAIFAAALIHDGFGRCVAAWMRAKN